MRTLNLLSSIFCFFLISTQVIAQKAELKDVIVVEFSAPYTQIIVNYESMEIPFTINKKTKVEGAKGKLDIEMINPGIIIDNLEYELVGNERIALSLKTDIDPNGAVEFTGLLEAVEGDVAIIDGRRVKLNAGVPIDPSGKKEM